MKTRLVFVTLVSLAVALALLTFGTYVVLSARVSASAETELRARADAAAAAVSVVHGRIRFDDALGTDLFDSGTWVFDSHEHLLEQPSGGSVLTDDARSLAHHGSAMVVELRDAVRMMVRPVVRDGARVATVVVAIPGSGYESALTAGLWSVIGLDVALLLIAALFVRRLVSAALRPVAEMTERADEWSVHDLDRRFHLGDAHDEISRLGTTFDQLLGRLSASIRAEQRLTAEIAHELRTPLARVSSDLGVALRRTRSDEEYRHVLCRTQDEITGLARVIDDLLASAASHDADSDGGASVVRAVQAAVGECLRRYPGVAIDVRAETDHLVACDLPTFVRLLVPVLSNATTYARSKVVVTVEPGDAVTVRVEDDGPGVPAGEQESIFEPGRRGSTAVAGGSGLGLSLSRRLARGCGGDVTARATSQGGRFTVVIPAAPGGG